MIRLKFSLLIAGFFISGCTASEENYSWIPDALLGPKTSYKNLYEVYPHWDCKPFVKFLISSETSDRKIIQALNDELMNLGKISSSEFNLNIIRQSELTGIRCGGIYIYKSETKGHGFNDIVKKIYVERYSLEELYEGLKLSNTKIKLDENFSSTNPCRVIFPWSIDKIHNKDLRHRIDIAIILISGDLEDYPLKSCIREELAHALFLIPDRLLDYDYESVFNITLNPKRSDEFTLKDKILMKFLIDNPAISGMSLDEIKKYIHNLQSSE